MTNQIITSVDHGSDGARHRLAVHPDQFKQQYLDYLELCPLIVTYSSPVKSTKISHSSELPFWPQCKHILHDRDALLWFFHIGMSVRFDFDRRLKRDGITVYLRSLPMLYSRGKNLMKSVTLYDTSREKLPPLKNCKHRYLYRRIGLSLPKEAFKNRKLLEQSVKLDKMYGLYLDSIIGFLPPV